MGNWSHSLSSPIAAELEAGPYRPPNPTMSIPQPEPWFAWIVPTIFIMTTLAFAASMYVNDCPGHFDNCLFSSYLGRYAFQSFKENPLLGPSPFTLVKMGALNKPLVVDKGEGWRLITCMWLHVGVIHLAANMTSLLFIGIRLEQEFGFWRIGLLFVLSGFGGSLTSALHLETISVGASGALFGLLGAMLSELIMNWSLYANKCAALSTLLLVIAFNLAIGLLPNIDSSAHIGGFVSGFLLGFILLIRPQFGYVSRKYIPEGYALKYVKPKHKCYQYLLWVVAFVILIVGYAIGLNKLFNGNPPTHLSNWVPPNVFNGNPPEQLFNRNQPDQLLNGQTPHQ